MSKRSSSIPAPAKPPASSRFWTEVRGYAEALVIAYLVVTFLFNTVGVVGSSMRPNLDGGAGSQNVLQSLLTGDRVFIPKYETWLRRLGIMKPYSRGDVVVVREPVNSPHAQERDRRPFFIKRVIGVPGDHVRIEEGQVFVNGFPLDQSFITASGEITPDPVNFPVVVTEDSEINGFVMGFNTTLLGTPVPDLPRRNYLPPALPLADPRVQLYYGGVVGSLAPLPAGVPDSVPVVTDLVVPAGQYFVMGDNRQSSRGGSEDSRYFGPVDSITVAGRASAIIWPPRRDGEWNWRRIRPPATFAAVPAPGN